MVVGAVICGLLFLPDDPDRVWRVTFSSLAVHVHKHTAPKSINQSKKTTTGELQEWQKCGNVFFPSL